MPRIRKRSSSSYSPVAYSRAVGNTRKGPLALFAGIAIIAAAAGVGYWLVNRGSADETSGPNSGSKAAVQSVSATEAPVFPSKDDLKPAWNLMNGFLVDASGSVHTIDPPAGDLGQAEKQVNEILKVRPSDDEALVMKAEIEGYYQSRGIEVSQARSDAEEKAAETAMQAAGDKPETLFAMAQAICLRSTVTNGAVQLLRQALKRNPGELRYRRLLFHDALRGEDSLDDAMEAAAKYPDDYGIQADAADVFRHFGLMEQADKAVSRAVQLSPDRGSTLLWKGYDAYLLRGDVSGMKEAVERVNGPTRATGQFAFVAYLCACLNKDTASAEAVLKAAPQGPLLGESYPVDAPFLLAQIGAGSFEPPLSRIRQELAKTPDDPSLRTLEIWALHGLNRNDEARARFKALVPLLTRPFRIQIWWFDPIALSVILGDRDTATALLKEAVQAPSPKPAITGARTDPRLGTWAVDPAVMGLLNRPE